jgi:cation diffusion facilitator family transporter
MAGPEANENRLAENAASDLRGLSPAKQRRKKMAAGLSIVSNSVLVLLKFLIGIGSGSISILSEALHSLTDLIASGIAFLSVRASDTPPDADHPYGHGKIESISGLLEALLIFVAGLYIVWESVGKLRAPGSPVPQVEAGLAVMGLSTLTNALLSRYLRRVARETDSLALEADGAHLSTDVWTSLGVFVGLALTRLTRQSWFDPLAALLVALLIFRTAYRLTRDSMNLLMDARLPVEEEAAIQDVLETDPRVLSYHKLRTRKSGSQRHVDVHIQIDDNSSLVQAHDLTEELEDRIRETLPATQVNIHIEPYLAEMRHQQEAHGIPMTPIQPLEPPLPGEPGPADAPPSHERSSAPATENRSPHAPPPARSFSSSSHTGARW